MECFILVILTQFMEKGHILYFAILKFITEIVQILNNFQHSGNRENHIQSYIKESMWFTEYDLK